MHPTSYLFAELSQMIELTPVAIDISKSHPKAKRNLASSIFCQINHKLKAGPIRAQLPATGPMGGQDGGARRAERPAILDNTVTSAAPNSVSVSDCHFYSISTHSFSALKNSPF